MIRSSVTISLVPEARGGPFVFWDDLDHSCATASALGFSAVELFLPSATAGAAREIGRVLERHNLKLAAMGTGAGWILHRLHLCHADPAIRQRARDFIGSIIDLAGSHGASAIIGSMQGRFENGVTREQALEWLAEGLRELSERAAKFGVPVLYEPLNRYETNLINRMEDAKNFLNSLPGAKVKILADLFHMNIEEESIPDGLRCAGDALGHLHFVDSNRRPAGLGHLNYGQIVEALRGIGYSGYASAEALPYPTPEEAARRTISTFRAHFGLET